MEAKKTHTNNISLDKILELSSTRYITGSVLGLASREGKFIVSCKLTWGFNVRIKSYPGPHGIEVVKALCYKTEGGGF
jgi:hypothetical protein